MIRGVGWAEHNGGMEVKDNEETVASRGKDGSSC